VFDTADVRCTPEDHSYMFRLTQCNHHQAEHRILKRKLFTLNYGQDLCGVQNDVLYVVHLTVHICVQSEHNAVGIYLILWRQKYDF
jgi:hypothetical protein